MKRMNLPFSLAVAEIRFGSCDSTRCLSTSTTRRPLYSMTLLDPVRRVRSPML